MLFNNKLFNSIACLLSFTNLQLVIPGRTWILLYLGRTMYKRLWACLALYLPGNIQVLYKSLQLLDQLLRLKVIAPEDAVPAAVCFPPSRESVCH